MKVGQRRELIRLVRADADQIFGVTGLAARTGLSDTLVRGLTYALVLHPIGTSPPSYLFILAADDDLTIL